MAIKVNVEKLNEYIKKFVENRLNVIDEEDHEDLLSDAELMSRLDVASDDDFKRFYCIVFYAPKICDELSGGTHSDKLYDILEHIYKNKYDINNILNMYHAVRDSLNHHQIQIVKKAYPNASLPSNVNPPYDITKWLTAMRDIYAKAKISGLAQAYNEITAKWDDMEKKDFGNWTKFYQGHNHEKYKIAQTFDVLKAHLPQAAEANATYRQPEAIVQNRQAKEKQREKIMGRLLAAKRQAYTPEGRELLGDELNKFIEALNGLETLIQTRKLSFTATDMITKQANVCRQNGLLKTASALDKLAADDDKKQDPNSANPAPVQPPASPLPSSPVPEPLPPIPPSPSPITPAPSPIGGGMAPTPTSDKGSKGPYDQLEDSIGKKSSDEYDIVIEAEPLSDGEIIITAQQAPAPQPPKQDAAPQQGATPTNAPPEPQVDSKKIDDIFDSALSNITVEDIIKRLEGVSNIFRNREIARQLTVVDLMMDKLGISTYFPSLGEATQKSLESNQYCSTRIDDIISKLRGQVSAQTIDLAAPPAKSSDDVEALKARLQKDKDLDKARKEQRKKQELEMTQPPAPPQEIAKEIQQSPAPTPAPVPNQPKPPIT